YFVEFLHEHCTFGAQPVHHVAVVHHFVTHVDGRTEQLQGTLDDADGAVDAGAEAAWIGKDDLHKYGYGRQVTKRYACHLLLVTSSISTSKSIARPANGWLKSTRTASSSTSRTAPGI